MVVSLTRVTYDPVGAIEEAAANCYNTKKWTPGKMMAHCINSGHLSVAEFAHFTFHIEGVSRALTHQLVRHRMASYAQRSQRYCGEADFEFFIPPTIKTKEQKALYLQTMQDINKAYIQLQKLDVPNEDARYVLPNACCTSIEVSMNLRELMHFMNERLCVRAQWEIRHLADAMRETVIAQFPELAPYLVPKCEAHGKEFAFCAEEKGCGRHPSLKEVFNKEKTDVDVEDLKNLTIEFISKLFDGN